MESLRKIKIIIVDNSNSFVVTMSKAIKEISYIDLVGTAENGRVALDLLKIIDCDIVMLDLSMPVMDGWEVLKIIKNRFNNTKVLIYSFDND